MQKSLRRKLFYLSIMVFIFLSIGVLSFAFGVTYDFTNKQIVKTGSLGLNTNVDAQIFLNGEPAGGTSLLGHSFSKRNLLPGLYTIGVKRDGFQSWQKEAEVTIGLVTDFAEILLVSEEPSPEVVASSVSAAFFSDHDRWAAYRQHDRLITLDLYNKTTVSQMLLSGFNLERIKVLWDPSYRKILVHDGAVAVIWDTEGKKITRIKNLPAYFLNEPMAFDGSKIYNLHFLKKQKYLESFDISTTKIDLVVEALETFYLFGDKLFFISNFDRRPYLLHLADNHLESFPTLPTVLAGPITKVDDAHDQLYFLAGGFLYATNQMATNLLAQEVKSFAISPDRYLLGWITAREVWTVGLKENLYQPQRHIGEKEKLLTTNDFLQNIAWHRDGRYLFLAREQSPILVEIDMRGDINQYPLFRGDSALWRYNSNLDKILQFKNEQLVLWSYY